VSIKVFIPSGGPADLLPDLEVELSSVQEVVQKAIDNRNWHPVVVFVASKAYGAAVVKMLRLQHIKVHYINGEIEPKMREIFINELREKLVDVLVVTDASGMTGWRAPSDSRILHAELPVHPSTALVYRAIMQRNGRKGLDR